MATKKKTKEYKQEILEPLVAGEPDAVYLNPSKRYSYADYLTWMDDTRRELIDGIVYVFSAPSRFHAEISGSIWLKFQNFVAKRRKGNCKIYHAPFDVRFPNNGETDNNKIYTVVQPDICVICDPSKLDEKGCIGAPDLIVEVQSMSTAKKDLREKFDLYEKFGVKEYWIVFPDKAITVFKLGKNGKYDQGTGYQFEGKVPVSIFKGLKIDLKELFQDM